MLILVVVSNKKVPAFDFEVVFFWEEGVVVYFLLFALDGRFEGHFSLFFLVEAELPDFFVEDYLFGLQIFGAFYQFVFELFVLVGQFDSVEEVVFVFGYYFGEEF